MEWIIDQLSFARQVTLQTVKEVTEEQARKIPAGFNNNLLWNLGHLFLYTEQFAFGPAQEEMEIPGGFREMFAMGAKPADWTAPPPSLAELLKLLADQPNRIREKLSARLTEKVAKPLAFPGITLTTVGELLTFNLYHEGVHIQAIRTLMRQ